MNASSHQRLSEKTLVVGAPLLLAVVELFHPHPHDLLNLDVNTWLVVHYAQIPLFSLSALAIATLVRDRADVAATVCRVAMFVFAVSYTAFDTAAGVVTGMLVKAAHRSGTPDAWRAPIDAVWTHPIMGGSPLCSRTVSCCPRIYCLIHRRGGGGKSKFRVPRGLQESLRTLGN